MSQTIHQTASVDQTGELSQAVSHSTTIGDEGKMGTDAARQLVQWELGRQQVTVDFSAGDIVTDIEANHPSRSADTMSVESTSILGRGMNSQCPSENRFRSLAGRLL